MIAVKALTGKEWDAESWNQGMQKDTDEAGSIESLNPDVFFANGNTASGVNCPEKQC